MARTQEYVDLEVLLEASFTPNIPEQWTGYEAVEFVESLPDHLDDAPAEPLMTTAEDLSGVTCIESIRSAAEDRYADNYEKLQRHGFKAVFSFAEIFNDIDKILEVSQLDPTVKMTVSDAEAQVMQAYKDASVHTVIRKVVSGEETDTDAARRHLEETDVSDGAKISIAKTFVDHIGTAIVATHRSQTPAEKQIHAKQSLLLTDLAKLTVGHVAVTSEEEKIEPVSFEQDFAFLQAVSRETVHIKDYQVKPRGRFTKKATHLVMNSVLAAFSIQPGAVLPAVVSSAAEAVVKSSPISARMADKLIEAISSDEQDLTAKVTIAKIVAPHESANKRVAAANLSLLTQAVTDEIQLKTGKAPAAPEEIADDSPMNIYVLVADQVVAENGPQLPEEHQELLTSYASLMKVVAANLEHLPEGFASVIIEQAQPGFVSTVRDLTIESISPDSTAEADLLMATMYANLDAVLYPTAAEQDKLLAEMLEETQPQPATPVPPVIVPPTTQPPVEAPTPPQIGEGQKTPEQKAADQAFLERVIDLHNQVVGDMWTKDKPVQPMDPTILADIINRIDAKYNHPAFGRKAALAQLFRESKFDNQAGSSAGAQGIAQFMPATWAALGKGGDVHDPEAAIDAQFRYMIGIYDKMKGYNPEMAPIDILRLTFAGYNSGPNLDVYKQGKLPDFKETQDYVKIIFGIMDKTTDQINTAVEALTLPEAPAGTRDLGIHDGSREGKPAKIRLVAIPGIPSSSGESQPGDDYYVEGANGELIVNAEIAVQVMAMVASAREQGLNLTVVSSFRTRAHQTYLWNKMKKDRSVVAPPGESDHETGLAVDFAMDGLPIQASAYKAADGSSGGKGNPRIAPGSKTWRWLQENAKTFGLVQYWKEPWHWSNRGAPAPTYIPTSAPASVPTPIDTPAPVAEPTPEAQPEIEPDKDKSDKDKEKESKSDENDDKKPEEAASDNSNEQPATENPANGTDSSQSPVENGNSENADKGDKADKADEKAAEQENAQEVTEDKDQDKEKDKDKNYLSTITDMFTE